MPINLLCPQCQKTLAVSEQFAGQAMRCPLCMAMFQAPVLAPGQGSVPMPPPPPPPQYSGGGTGVLAPPAPSLEGLRSGDDKLATGWHMVRRGLTIIPVGVLISFFVLLTAQLVLIMGGLAPDSGAAKMVKMIAVPVTILATIVAVFGFAFCSLVPGESGLRNLALGAAGALLLAMLALGVTGFIPQAALAPTDNFFGILLAFAGGLTFLFFLRGVALAFKNARQAQEVLYAIIGIGASPVVFFFIWLLLTATNAAVGGTGSGRNLLAGVALYLIIAADLFWFLRVLRDVRRTVEKSYLGYAVGA